MDLPQRFAALATVVAATLEDGMTVGLGSGSTAEAVVEAIGRRVAEGLTITGVPTSLRTERLASSLGIPLRSLDEVTAMDLGIDGADEIDPRLNLVKGRGGALLYEKLVASACRDYLVVATSEKLVEQLGTRMPVPVEVIPFGHRQTAERLRALGCDPVLRTAEGKPYLTDGGHYIYDCETGPFVDPVAQGRALKAVTGIVDHGIFTGIARRAMTVDAEGMVMERRA
jgi:ribose 5-phosphate isomerase A